MKRLALLLISTLSPLMIMMAAPVVAAAAPASGLAVDTSSACQALTQLNSTQDCSTGGSGVTGIIHSVIKILGIVVGIVAVIMIIIAGFTYITSGGESSKVASAKNTLIYALVGVAIAILAEFLVHFVINTSTAAAGNG